MDKITKAARSANMRAIKSKDSRPEMSVRKLLHARGYRYRLHNTKLPGKPDLVFTSRRAVIFVHGCYWHGHGCKRGGSGAKSNVDYWSAKIQRNVRRDEETLSKLAESGWRVKVVWECEIRDLSKLADDLSSFLDDADYEELIAEMNEAARA